MGGSSARAEIAAPTRAHGVAEVPDRNREQAFDIALRHTRSVGLLDTLHRIIGRYERDPHEAEDLLQEILLRAWDRWEQYDGRAPFHKWLTAIAVNVCRSHIRSTVRRRGLLDRRGAHWLESDTLPQPDARCADAHPRLMAAFRSLPTRHQTALRLRLVDEVSTEVAAARMGCATGSVRSLLSRGLARLRQELEACSTQADSTV